MKLIKQDDVDLQGTSLMSSNGVSSKKEKIIVINLFLQKQTGDDL